jgi:hypothetical protein
LVSIGLPPIALLLVPVSLLCFINGWIARIGISSWVPGDWRRENVFGKLLIKRDFAFWAREAKLLGQMFSDVQPHARKAHVRRVTFRFSALVGIKACLVCRQGAAVVIRNPFCAFCEALPSLSG